MLIVLDHLLLSLGHLWLLSLRRLLVLLLLLSLSMLDILLHLDARLYDTLGWWRPSGCRLRPLPLDQHARCVRSALYIIDAVLEEDINVLT